MATTTPPTSRFSVPSLAGIPEGIRACILEVQEENGFVPNVFLALSRQPDECHASFAYHDALVLREDNSPTKGEREMVVVATSAANQCLYCVVTHDAILRICERNLLMTDQVTVNYRKVDITPRQCAILDSAMKVYIASHTVNDADYEALRVHGFDDENIWDIVGITALLGLSNRMANAISMQPNEKFFLLGHLLRERKT